MDFQNRPGGKTGGGGVASWSENSRDRRERLRQLALETIDLNKDPYFMKNHLGSYECKLCLTLHNNEGSYLAHTQGKKHQANLARRAAKEAKEAPQTLAPEKPRVEPKKFVKIGRPGYRVTKQRDPESGQQSLLFQVDYPEVADNVIPRHRFMSAYEQRVEPPDRKWQYLLFAAEPYETIAFKVLEKYYTLLEAQQDVNLNKAALVLQNSANTYVRRVEYLFQDTTSLMQNYADQEVAIESTKSAKKDSKEKKTVIDIVDFEPIDFSQYVGKNNNMKNRNVVNSVKLLGQRFPQLEISSRSSKSVEFNTIETDQDQDNDEDIVKRYAFRCNQYITASGMLVEHLEPEDFPLSSSSPEQIVNMRTGSKSYDEISAREKNRDLTNDAERILHDKRCCVSTPLLESGKLDDQRCCVSTPLLESGKLDDQRCCVSTPLLESGILDDQGCCVSTPLLESGKLDEQRCYVTTPLPETETDMMDTSFCSAVDSGRGSSVQTTMRPDSSLSSVREHWDTLPPRGCSRLSINDAHSIADSVHDTELRNEEIAVNDISPSKRGAEERDNTTDCTNVDIVSSETEKLVIQHCRRSKRLRSVFDVVKTFDSNPLEPIPFDSVPDMLPKSRAEFKLPCPISLLKFKERPRKRKITTEAKKRRCWENFFSSETVTGNKKLTVYSPTKQLFFPFMKEEFEYLPKCFNKHWRNRQNLRAIHYEAVTNATMDLLGYKSHERKPDSLNYEITNKSKIATTTDMPSIADDFPNTTNELSNTTNNRSNTTNNLSNLAEDCPSTTINFPSAAIDFPSTEIDFPSTANDFPDLTDDFPMPDTPESSNSPEPTSPITYSSRIERSVRDIYETADVRTEQDEAVIKWHEDIQVKLREIKHRPKFEMADYTARVMKSLKDNGGSVSFETMIRQNKTQEAARYLLASLTLANKYDLRIDTSDDEGNVMLLLLKE